MRPSVFLKGNHLFFRSRSNGEGPRKLNTMQLGDLLSASNTPHFKGIPMIVDLAFASNVRFLDEYELHLTDVELYKVRGDALRQAYFFTDFFSLPANGLPRFLSLGRKSLSLDENFCCCIVKICIFVPKFP